MSRRFWRFAERVGHWLWLRLWRQRLPERRVRLADDIRRLAAFADVTVEEARRLGAEVPDGVAACSTVWRSWADRLRDWASGGEQP